MRNLSAILLVAGGGLLSSCDMVLDAHQWQGWVYPNKNALTNDIPLGKFSSLAECRDSAKKLISYLPRQAENGSEISADYECGRKCRPIGDGMNMCAETLR